MRPPTIERFAGSAISSKVVSVRLAILACVILSACGPDTKTPEQQLALEQAFEESMRGVVLDGNFTIVPQSSAGEVSDEGPPRLRNDRYEIEKVVKRAGDIWTFHARIQYGDKDVTLPVPVKLSWAGDTPMVSVTDLGLPGLGTYTARVVFYRDSYAGMWWGGQHGGNMFGRIVRSD